MKNKVISITEKIPQITTLPNGFYNGLWGGDVIEIKSEGKYYQLKTEEGVRGMNIKVIVEIKDGVATFDTVHS